MTIQKVDSKKLLQAAVSKDAANSKTVSALVKAGAKIAVPVTHVAAAKATIAQVKVAQVAPKAAAVKGPSPEDVERARVAETNARLQEAKARLAYAKQKQAFEALEAKTKQVAAQKDSKASVQTELLVKAGARVAPVITHSSVADIALTQAKQSLEVSAISVTKAAAETIQKQNIVRVVEAAAPVVPPKGTTQVSQEKAADTLEKNAAAAGGGAPQSTPPAPGSILPLVLAAAVALGLYKVLKK